MNRCVHRAYVFNGLAGLQLGTFNYGYYWVKINSEHWETYIKRFQDHVCWIVSKGILVQLIRIPLLWGKFSYIELKYYIGMSFRVHVSLACGFFSFAISTWLSRDVTLTVNIMPYLNTHEGGRYIRYL